MGALDAVAARVAAGATVQFRPSGSSMAPLIRSRQLVTVAPVDASKVEVDDIVLARVSGTVYLHLVSAVEGPSGRVQISNRRGRVNGWTTYARVFGICTAVEGVPRPRVAEKLRRVSADVDSAAPHGLAATVSRVQSVETQRLVIRGFRASDAAVFSAYRSDPVVARYQSWTPPVPLNDAAALVAQFGGGDPRVPGWFQYAVALRSDEAALIGDIGVHLHENLMQAEIGFTFAPKFQGQGYATEAVLALLRHLFSQQRLLRVSAECDARNAASARLLERVGFAREGLRRRHTWIKDEWTDDLLFGLLAKEFSA